jgi:hypothetical protein
VRRAQIAHLQPDTVVHASDDRVDAPAHLRPLDIVEVARFALPQHRQRPRCDGRGDQVRKLDA